MKKLLTLTALGTIMMATNANASGFNLKEQSVAAQGNAFAGATAGAEDISYSYFNAAGLTRHKGTKVVVGGTYIAPRSKAKWAEAGPAGSPFEDSEINNGNIVHAAVAPNMSVSHQLNDKWTVGASLNVPYGMVTKYEDDWAGKYHGTLSKVTTVTVTPMAAYKATDKLSLGAGLQMQYIKARLRNSSYTPPISTNNATTLEGYTFDIGYQLGAMYEFTQATRVGVGYRSEVKHKLKGDIEFAQGASMLNQDIGARLTTPANLTIGAYHDINEQWSVMAEYGRTFWSSFDELRIVGDKGLNSVTEERWDDTNFYAIGASYKYDDSWKFRLGMAIDESAVGEEYRTPRIPDSDRLWYSGGIQYTQNENITWNLAYTYIRAEKGRVALKGTGLDAARGSLDALYKNDIHMLGVSFNYSF